MRIVEHSYASDAIIVDENGYLYFGCFDGVIRRFNPNNDEVENVVDLGKVLSSKSIPLGLAFAFRNGVSGLLITDPLHGILFFDMKTKKLEIITSKGDVNVPNDIIVSKTNPNIAYFTDSTKIPITDNFDLVAVLFEDYLIANPSGRYVTIFSIKWKPK